MQHGVAIVEYDCFSSAGLSLAESWERLADNQSGIGPITRYEVEAQTLQGLPAITYGGQIPQTFAALAGSSAQFNRWPEPSFHAIQSLTKIILERFDFDISQHDPQRIAILGGTVFTGEFSSDLLARTQRADSKFLLNQCHNIPMAAAASEFGFQGPCYSIGGACASSGHAILLATQLMRCDLIDCALVFGYEFPLVPATIGGLAWLNALYKKDLPGDRGYDDPAQASRPFSKDRRGFIPAEGVGGIFMSRPDYVRQRGWPIKGMILGGYANSDAGHLTRLSQENVALCMHRALEAAGCNREDIDCINAHATSTPYGDRAEMTALAEVFGEHLGKIPVVANKSQIGHSIAAASILELMLAVEGMRRNVVLPTLNYMHDPDLPKAMVPTEALEYSHHVTLSSSFGFGGTNVSLVVTAATG